MGEDVKTFDPSKYLTEYKRRSKQDDGSYREVKTDYLPVKARILWFRDEHPDGVIDTDCVAHDENFALFKAMIDIPNGGMAVAWGSETKADWKDYIEKAETKAVGRALAALGYGTQFAAELSEGDVVDSPVVRPETVEGEHYCQVHKVAFQRREKDGKVWYSHRLADGTYCNERVQAPEPRPSNDVAKLSKAIKDCTTQEELDGVAQTIRNTLSLSKADRATLLESYKNQKHSIEDAA